VAPGTSAARATFLVNLANAASERHAWLGADSDLVTARDAYRSAVTSGLLTSPADALAGARNWSERARPGATGSGPSKRTKAGTRPRRCCSRARCCAATRSCGSATRRGDGGWRVRARCPRAPARPRDAATALERGRGLLLSERLERDPADVTRLEREHALLAERFRAAAARLRALEVAAATAG
jgi:hypothetical protein